MIQYIVKARQNDAHLIKISMIFDHTENNKIQFFLPNWTPGSYKIRDFSRHVFNINATLNGIPQRIVAINKNTWELPATRGKWEIEYTLYAAEISVRTAFLDASRMFFDGASTLMGILGRTYEQCSLQLIVPNEWQSMCSLTQQGRVFVASNYAELIDSPVTAGRLKVIDFKVNDINHYIVITGNFDSFDEDRLKNDIQTICTHHTQFFGRSPFRQYYFMLHVGQNLYGGLEHRASTALMASRRDLPSKKHNENRADYIRLLGLMSHEYFHAWNVKSIKPKSFESYDLQKEIDTTQLWAMEGITSYYDDLALLKTGLISPEEYLNLLLKNLDALYQSNGRYHQSLAQSGFEAWTKYYQQDENSHNISISYYQKGMIAALCWDILLRRDGSSLDEVMRTLFDRFCDEGFLPADDDWQKTAESITGKDFSAFFNTMINGTNDIPLEDYLTDIGVDFRLQATLKAQLTDEFTAETSIPYLGANWRNTPQGLQITRVYYGSPAQKAGLTVGDCLIALNQRNTEYWDEIWRECAPGDEISLHFWRDAVLHKIKILLEPHPTNRPILKINHREKLLKFIQS